CRKELAFAAAFVRRLWRGTAECDFTAFFLAKIDVELDFIELCLVHDRALLGFLVERIAHLQLGRFVDKPIDEIFISRALDEYARTAQATLALSCVCRAHPARD